MEYQDLKKIYYKNNEKHKEIYYSRFNAPFTEHLDFLLQQFGYKEKHEAFFCYTNEIISLIEAIYHKSLKLYRLVDQMPLVGIISFLNNLMVQEIKANNAIEGVHSNRKEIEFAMNLKNPRKYIRLWGIVNKYEKILKEENIPLDTCEDIRNLYNDFLYKEIERDDPLKLPDGEFFRKNSVDVVSATNKIIHRGVYSESEIINKLQYALNVLHSKKLPLLIRISLFHCMFAYIHPFYDGNGRMVRFITSYFLAKEIHPTIALRLSFLIKRNSKKYYDSFILSEDDRNCGDLTPFLTYSLQLILTAVESTASILAEKLELFCKYQGIVSYLGKKDITMIKICDVLLQATIFSQHGATIDEISNTIDKTRKTVQKRIDTFSSEILLIDTGSKPYHYKFRKKYLATWLNENGQ